MQKTANERDVPILERWDNVLHGVDSWSLAGQVAVKVEGRRMVERIKLGRVGGDHGSFYYLGMGTSTIKRYRCRNCTSGFD
jgi:hypothetical protein